MAGLIWPLRDRLPRLSLPVRAPLSGALMTGTLLLCPLPDHFAVRLALSVLLGSAVYLASLSLMRARLRPVLP